MTDTGRRKYAPTHAVRTALQAGPLPPKEIHTAALKLQPDLSPKFIDRVIRRGARGDKAWLRVLDDGRVDIKGGSA
jgi:hypothetical protein